METEHEEIILKIEELDRKQASKLNLDDIKNDTILEFQKQVEEIHKQDVPYIAAIITVCENNNLDPEEVKNLLSPNLLMKLTEEAINLNLIKQTAKRLV